VVVSAKRLALLPWLSHQFPHAVLCLLPRPVGLPTPSFPLKTPPKSKTRARCKSILFFRCDKVLLIGFPHSLL